MGELPSGTVTFLFTDIEGSTRLLHELGDAYAGALAEHRRVLREAFARHGGVEVDTQGDAFFVAFARASDALAAAADGQAGLVDAVRVRMGVHTGEPLLTDEGYVGIDVHRAARIAAVGYGGQVLVSQSTRELVASDDFRDLGEHRLKDLTAPERIYQLGDGEFPPLKTLYQAHLPIQPTPLVGRERELSDVRRLLCSRRLLTLTGAGGSGKTRLALQLAAEIAEGFPDGVWFVSLASVTDPSLVEPAIASALGVSDELAGFLKQKRLLLVLDNLEQLLPAAAGLVAGLLDAPRICVVATSRERLAVAAEQEYEVPTLGLEDAAALFTTRAAQLKPTFQPDEYVREIAARLDGLPLAVELAAARVKVLTTTQILERLSRSLSVLTTGARDAPDRQRTLRATIEWSYDLLSADEQALFARLGVFAGSFELEAAEVVADADLDLVASLVDKSLLRRTADGRFFMLETIREFARERLAAANGDDIFRRHAAYLIERAAEPPDSTKVEWRAGIARDYADFTSALTWLQHQPDATQFSTLVARLADFWNAQDRLREGRKWLQEMLGRSEEVTLQRARARDTLAQLMYRQGDHEASRAQNDLVQHEANQLGDLRLLAFAKASRGALEYVAGNLDAAASESTRSIELFTRVEEPAMAGLITHDLGLITLTAGDAAGARVLFERARASAAEHGYLRAEAGALGSLGYVAVADGTADEALSFFREALRLYSRLGEPGLAAATDLYGLAAALALEGRTLDASTIVAAADAYFDDVGAAREPLPEQARSQALEIVGTEFTAAAADRARSRGAEIALAEAVSFALEEG